MLRVITIGLPGVYLRRMDYNELLSSAGALDEAMLLFFLNSQRGQSKELHRSTST